MQKMTTIASMKNHEMTSQHCRFCSTRYVFGIKPNRPEKNCAGRAKYKCKVQVEVTQSHYMKSSSTHQTTHNEQYMNSTEVQGARYKCKVQVQGTSGSHTVPLHEKFEYSSNDTQ